jgi:hypothetical protein
MKNVLILPAALMLLTGMLGAQETGGFSLGFGMEGNFNTRKGIALGQIISLEYDLNKTAALGAKFAFNQDFGRIMVLETAAFGRWNLFDFGGKTFFLQGDLGLSLVFEESQRLPLFLGGLTLGLRFPLGQWYVEPYLRTGYPFIWGAGVMGGYRF